ncbi:MAG: hypothetical protein H6550_08680 [Chitinophagales bacterium]|nr:hypothetical protein [Chitinophagales bacterium]
MIAKRTKQLPHWWAYVLVTLLCLALMVFTWLYYQRGIDALNDRAVIAKRHTIQIIN